MNEKPLFGGVDADKLASELFKTQKEASRGIFTIFKCFAALWFVWALVGLALTAGVVYVAWHFISKLW